MPREVARQDVAVVVTTYNRATLVVRALRSVLAQSHRASEIVVVDDGSSDHTRANVEGLGCGIRYLFQRNAGHAAALNKGVMSTTCPLVAFLDSDDVWMPEKLAVQSASMAKMGPGLLYCSAWVRHAGIDTAPAIAKAAFLPSALMTHRSVLARLGAFDTSLRVGALVEWHARALHRGEVVHAVDAPLFERWIHGNNLARLTPQVREEYLRAMHRVARHKRMVEERGS